MTPWRWKVKYVVSVPQIRLLMWYYNKKSFIVRVASNRNDIIKKCVHEITPILCTSWVQRGTQNILKKLVFHFPLVPSIINMIIFIEIYWFWLRNKSSSAYLFLGFWGLDFTDRHGLLIIPLSKFSDIITSFDVLVAVWLRIYLCWC